MAVDRSLIGAASNPQVFEVERGAIRKFAEAIGDPHPAYQRGEIAPPTFPTTFRVEVPGLSLDLSRALHGEEEYEYVRPIRAGDRITVVQRVTDVFQREGSLGRMTFLVLESAGTDEEGNLVYKGRSTVIVREGG
ncbi:MAG TPA: MaoC family dehydratase N-terminal domain-containing protein [Symbiobacteriaceae bacterium]